MNCLAKKGVTLMGEEKNFVAFKRKRIEEELEKLFTTGLFIVTGKGGYGKTTEVLEFLRRQNNIDTIYLSLMFSENDEIWLWKKLCTAFKAISESLSKEMDLLGFPDNNFDIDNIIEVLCKNITRETVLVCDDCNDIDNERIKRLIERIAFERIPYFHIVLITRKTLSSQYTYYELKNKCVILKDEVFTFNKNEIGELFNINGIEVNEENINEIYDYTFGWPLYVYLLVKGYDLKEQLFYNLLKGFKLIKNLLYARMEEKEQNILLKLSLLDEFSIKQAVYITEESAERIIKTLEHENLCVYYEVTAHTYKFNNLFKLMLRGELEKSSIDEEKIYDKWMEWCVKKKAYIKILEKIIFLEEHKVEDMNAKNAICNSFKNICERGNLKQFNVAYEDLELSFLHNSILCKFHRKYSQMKNVLNKAQRCIKEFINFTDGCGYGLEYLITGEYLYMIGNLKEAEVFVHKAIEKAENKNQHSIYVYASFLLMKILWNNNDKNILYIKINKLEEYAEAYALKNTKVNIDLAGAYIYGLLGKKDRISDWIKEYSRNLYEIDKNDIEEMFNVIGILLLLEERYSELNGLCKIMVQKYIHSKNIIGLVYTHIYDAAAAYKLQEINSAAEAFIKAINIAKRDNIIMPFVELSAFINDLIINLRENSSDFMKDIIKNITVCAEVSYENVCGKTILKNNSIFELTERESEVMELICTGETQNDIAENLHVSINTVRYHLKNIYEKLEVNNKTLAIEKYRNISAKA